MIKEPCCQRCQRARMRTTAHLLHDTPFVCLQGPRGELGSTAPRLQELDLAGCLLPSWAAVVPLASELPRVRTLDLSCARLDFEDAGGGAAQDPGPPGGPGSGGRALDAAVFSALRLLVLNRTGVTWPQVRVHACTKHLQRFAACSALCCKSWEGANSAVGAWLASVLGLAVSCVSAIWCSAILPRSRASSTHPHWMMRVRAAVAADPPTGPMAACLGGAACLRQRHPQPGS